MGVREECLAAVGARLELVAARRDLSLVLEPAAVTEAAQLAEVIRADHGDLQACYLLGWLYWYRHQALPAGQRHRDLDTAIRYLLPCFVNGAGDLPELLLPVLAGHAAGPARAMLREAQHSADPALISVTAEVWQRIADATPSSRPGRAAVLSDLATALRVRFWNAGELADLDAAIEAGRR